MTRIITTDEITEHFSMEDCIEKLEEMFAEMGARRAITDSREDILTPVPDPPKDAVEPVYHGLKSMGGSIPMMGVGAIRINSDVINWQEHGGAVVREKIPAADGRYTGLVLLFSTNTGEPLAIFPDGYVQSHRVAATSALGAKYLAPEDADRLGVLGAGQQARAHLVAHDLLQDLDTVRVYSPSPESRQAFAAEASREHNLDVLAVKEPERIFEGADIVQTATNATEPVFERKWIEPGTHVGIIKTPEAPDTMFDPAAFDAFVQSWSPVDQLEVAGNRIKERTLSTKNANNYIVAGDESVPTFQQYEADPLCDWSQVPSLGELVAGETDGRCRSNGVTFFYNAGMGIQFAAAGKTLYEIAEEKDLGQKLPTELLTQQYHP